MGEIDSKARAYVKQPAIFADLFNYLLYDGEQKIKPSMLKEADPVEAVFLKRNRGKDITEQKYRDVLKNAVIMQDDNFSYHLILGVENQTSVHYAMPVKNMVYDALNYSGQVYLTGKKHKENEDISTGAEYISGFYKNDKLLPVITVVLYFGQEPWDGPMSIKEMLIDCDKRVLPFVQDYKINLISPISMEISDIEKFQTDLRELAKIIKCSNDQEAMEETLKKDEERFKNMDYLTADLACSVTSIKLPKKNREKETIDMCKAWADQRQAGYNEGLSQGISQGFSQGISQGFSQGISQGISQGKVNTLIFLVNEGLLSIKDAARIAGLTEDEFEKKLLNSNKNN